MSDTLMADDWVFVVVQNPGKEETIVGQQDVDHGIQFIPVFRTKDIAQQSIAQMARIPGRTYEVQAILFEDLLQYATDGGFMLFVLDGGGRILSKVGPDGQPL